MLAAEATTAVAGSASAATAGGAAPAASATEPADIFDYEKLAPSHMSKVGWEYVSGGAADELSLRWNHEAYE